MQQRKTPFTARDAPSYELEWEVVEPASTAPGPRDVLGLTPEDRRALGLTAPRTGDFAPTLGGDATDALREAMAHGGSYGKRPPRAK